MLSKITVSNNFMEIQMGGGGGVFELGNREGRGLKQFWKSRWMGGGAKNCAFRCGSVDFFWNNPMLGRHLLQIENPVHKT